MDGQNKTKQKTKVTDEVGTKTRRKKRIFVIFLHIQVKISAPDARGSDAGAEHS